MDDLEVDNNVKDRVATVKSPATTIRWAFDAEVTHGSESGVLAGMASVTTTGQTRTSVVDGTAAASKPASDVSMVGVSSTAMADCKKAVAVPSNASHRIATSLDDTATSMPDIAQAGMPIGICTAAGEDTASNGVNTAGEASVTCAISDTGKPRLPCASAKAAAGVAIPVPKATAAAVTGVLAGAVAGIATELGAGLATGAAAGTFGTPYATGRNAVPVDEDPLADQRREASKATYQIETCRTQLANVANIMALDGGSLLDVITTGTTLGARHCATRAA